MPSISPVLQIGFPGGMEWIYIILILVILFGGKKFPEIARSIGQAVREFRKGMASFSEMTSLEGGIKKPEKAETKAEREVSVTEVAQRLGIEAKGKSAEQLAEEIIRKAEGSKESKEAGEAGVAEKSKEAGEASL